MTDVPVPEAQDPTPPPRWDPNEPDLPDPRLAQDSAVEAEAMAGRLLRALDNYRERLRPALEAGPPAVDAAAVDQVVALRRRVAIVTDMMIRQDFPGGTTATAQVAHRVAERIAGLTLLAAVRAGVLTEGVAEQVIGPTAVGFRALGEPSDDEFEAAIDEAVARGDASRDVVVAALGESTVLDREQRATIVRMAAGGSTAAEIGTALALTPAYVLDVAARHGITLPAEVVSTPAVDAAYFVPAVIEAIEQVAATARLIDPEAIAALSTAQAADYAAAVFDHVKHLVALRVRLDEFAQGRRPR